MSTHYRLYCIGLIFPAPASSSCLSYDIIFGSSYSCSSFHFSPTFDYIIALRCSCWALPNLTRLLLPICHPEYTTAAPKTGSLQIETIVPSVTDHTQSNSHSTHNNRQCFQQVSGHYCCCPSPCERLLLKHKRVTTAQSYAAGNTTTSHTWAPTTVRSSETRQQHGVRPATSSTTAQSNCKPACASSQPKFTQQTEHGAYVIAAAICSTPAR